MNIIGLFPLTGNGGIASWTNKFLSTFPDNDYCFFPVNVSPDEKPSNRLKRFCLGLRATRRIKKDISEIITENKIDILHTTTSGNLGSFRDIEIAWLCKKHGIKTILHCRYGCMPEDYNSRGIVGFLLRKSLSLFDQIWVLDKRTFNFLQNINHLNNKVFLTPNSIEVNSEVDFQQKEFKRVAFVGNLYPTKGLYELTEAALQCDVRLDIIGPGTEDVINHLKSLVGGEIDKRIFIHGKLPNNEAVEFMRDVDIIALPTYYSSEAFPISILEAMSLTKMVISCPRAAIPDMLTGMDGRPCGILVPERSVQGIADAFKWCQGNKEDANTMCRKAYEKVFNCYRTDVIYDIYRSNYNLLISS
jgi:glycosyltransferase involved in cell wall biosynthesis